MARFWVMGPVETKPGCLQWAAVDGRDGIGRAASKPAGYKEFWDTEPQAEAHCAAMNKLDGDV